MTLFFFGKLLGDRTAGYENFKGVERDEKVGLNVYRKK